MSDAGDRLDRVRDLLFDWGQDFAEDEDVRMHAVLEDLWSAIAGMPEGTKVDALPSRAPVLCAHQHPAEFAETWDRLMDELGELRHATQRVRGLIDLARQGAAGSDPAGLTTRQQQIVEFIRDTLADRGYAPSIREIGDAVGLTSSSSVVHQLDALAEKGVIRRDPNRPRALILSASTATVPALDLERALS